MSDKRPHRRPNAQDRLDEWFHDKNAPVTNRLQNPDPSPGHHLASQEEGCPSESDDSVRGTSRLVGHTNRTDHPSLPGLTRLSTTPSHTVPSSWGARAVDEHIRILNVEDGTLLPRPPFGRRGPRLECPLNILGCLREYNIDSVERWLDHTLSHFFTTGPGRRGIQPPQQNACPFCVETFSDQDAIVSWTKRMSHVFDHHQLGHTLSHARPDFELLRHLWQQGAITDFQYRELAGSTADASRNVAGHPSPPMTVVRDEEDSEAVVYTDINGGGRRGRR